MQYSRGVACLLVLALAHSCSGYPSYWIDPSQNFEPPTPASVPGCLDHPTSNYGKHGKAVADAGVQFVITNKATAAPAAKVCPGVVYTVQLTTPSVGYALLSSSVGSFADGDTTCPGRVAFDPNINGNVPGKSDTWTSDLTVPCTATGTVALEATSAANKQDGFHTNTAAVQVDATCAAASCGSTTPATPPTTTTSKSPAATSTKSPTPASTPTDDDDDDDGTASTAASPAPATPSTTSTTPTAASSETKTAATFASSMCSQPVTTKGSTCTASALGYSCSATVSGVTTHWTIGGCPPSNPCTKTYTLRTTSAPAAQAYLHYAASYPTTGYVSVGFASNPGKMPGTDAVIGWVATNGSAVVNSYYITGTSVSPSNLVSAANQWMVLSGASVEAGVTTVCFSRPVTASGERVVKALSASADVPMNWAVGRNNQRSLSEHPAAGGFNFNPSTGQVSAASGTDYSLIHGVLMAAAWVLLAPLGVLFARHKWALGEKKMCGVHWWFHAHRAIQMLAVVLFVLGFVLAFVKLGEPDGGVGKAHKWLGIVMMAMAGLQVLAAFIRPAGGSANRRAWNLFHRNLGRLTLTAGIVNTFLGIIVYRDTEQKSVGAWFVAGGALVALWVVLDVILILLGWRHRSNADKERVKDVEVAVINPVEDKPAYGNGQQASRW